MDAVFALCDRIATAAAAATEGPFQLDPASGAIETVREVRILTGPPDWRPVTRRARVASVEGDGPPGTLVERALSDTPAVARSLVIAVRGLQGLLVEAEQGREFTATAAGERALAEIGTIGERPYEVCDALRLGEALEARGPFRFDAADNTVRDRAGRVILRIDTTWQAAATRASGRRAEQDGEYAALALTWGRPLALSMFAALQGLNMALGDMPPGHPIKMLVFDVKRAFAEIPSALGLDP